MIITEVGHLYFLLYLYLSISASFLYFQRQHSLYQSVQMGFIPGPGCSKLTTSLVNVSLKFQMLISQIHQYFLLKKMREAFAVQKLLLFF